MKIESKIDDWIQRQLDEYWDRSPEKREAEELRQVRIIEKLRVRCLQIEEAHKRAANSTLHFGAK